MKKLTYLTAPVFAFMLLAASCSKDETTPATPTPTTPVATTPTAVSPMPSGNDISGALISINMVYSSQPAGAPFPVELETEIGTALFYSTPGGTAYTDAGTVSVNTNALEKQTNNTYTKLAYAGATPSTLNFDNGSNWNVGGSGSVTAFSYNHGTTFPKFTGTVPASVTKANGVSFSFNSSTITSADSVYVVIAAGNANFTKGYSASAGTINITASELAALPTVTDNSAIIEVCPFKYTITTLNSKRYVFIKEQAIVKNININ